MGDKAFFEALNGGASGEWGALEGDWDSLISTRPPELAVALRERGRLVDALVRSLFPCSSTDRRVCEPG